MKIIRNIFKIHPLTYLFLFIAFFCGEFKRVILYMILIIVHELGHSLTGSLFGWKISSINIYPLGGLTIFNEGINKPLFQEFFVIIMGPIFQIIISFFLIRFDESVSLFNIILLTFNLLPIVPLDGSKFISLFLSIIFPYRCVLYLVIIISYICFFFSLFFVFKLKSLFLLLVFLLLVFKIIDESKKNDYFYNKFLLERYLYFYGFKKSIIINKLTSFYKYKRNIIVRDNHLFSEKEILKEYYCKKM